MSKQREDLDAPPSSSATTAQAGSRLSPATGEISVLDLLVVLGRGKGLIVSVTCLGALMAAIVCMFLPIRYTASLTLLPPQQASPMAAILSSQLGGAASLAGGLGMKNPADLYVSLLKSRSVEEAVIKRFGLMSHYHAKTLSQTRGRLEQRFVIASTPKDGLIKVTVEDDDPKHAAEMANAYVEEYGKFSAHLAVTEASQRRLFFEQQLVQARDNLATAEESMKRSEQSSGMIHLDSQAKALIESAAATRAQIAAKEVKIRALQTSETNSNPDMMVAKEELAALQSQLRRLGGTESGTESELVAPGGNIPQAGLDYVRNVRNVKYSETIFELLAKQLEAAKLDEARQGSTIQVVDPAEIPDQKSSPNRKLIVMLSTLASFAMSALFVLLRAGLNVYRQEPEEKKRLQLLADVWSYSHSSELNVSAAK